MNKGIRKLLAAVTALGMTMSLFSAGITTVSADTRKIVTLGANLDDSQRKSILKYFGVSSNEVDIITITNDDERRHLASYIPIEQIGTRTFSCAYVQPTTSGGIRVKTANLTYVTSNMIASSLSTSGVKNCNVIAAAPFAVSGTGALTGCIMAYEAATGETLSASKKDAAAKEMVTTSDIAQSVGQSQATEIVNNIKLDVIQNNVDQYDQETINRIVEDAVNRALEKQRQQYEGDEVEVGEISFSQDEIIELKEFAEQIAAEDYEIDDVAETIDRVMDNVTDGEYSETDVEGDDYIDPIEDDSLDDDNILMNTDDFALGDDVVIDATDAAALEDIPVIDETEDDGYDVFDFSDENGESVEFNSEDDSEYEEFNFEDEGDEEYEEFSYEDESNEEYEEVNYEDESDDAADDSGEEEVVVSDSADFSLVFDPTYMNASFDNFAARFYVDGAVSAEYGSVSIIDMSGNTIKTIDASELIAVPVSSDKLNEYGWSAGTQFYAPLGGSTLSDSSYTVSVDVSFSDNAAGSIKELIDSADLSYVPSRFSDITIYGDFADMTINFPEDALTAELSSSNSSAIAWSDSSVSVDESYASLLINGSGSAVLTADFYDADGNYIDSTSVTIGYAPAYGSSRAE